MGTKIRFRSSAFAVTSRRKAIAVIFQCSAFGWRARRLTIGTIASGAAFDMDRAVTGVVTGKK